MSSYAWIDRNSNNRTKAAGSKRSNAWRLLDMHGNVWEWCLDWYGTSLPGTGATDCTGPGNGTKRVIKGGGWFSDSWLCQVAARESLSPGETNSYVGFRVVLMTQ